ncbi:Uncharacterized protein SCG7086_AB_00440 [Chlamydiales bacterium SCGC AG-110-P3]|nr:Uncharacterized protein SCG7086_AB_00440 [Chlamydiales bacterium SCGC AG-110-P3]
MFDISLFLGLPVTEAIQKGLNRANPHALPLFINNDSDYLHEYVTKGIRYIGKFVDAPANMSTLELSSKNIESLVCKLIPDFSIQEFPLYVVATVNQPPVPL